MFGEALIDFLWLIKETTKKSKRVSLPHDASLMPVDTTHRRLIVEDIKLLTDGLRF